METTQVSIDRWINKQNVVYLYSGIFFSFIKEENSNTCYNMDEPGGYYTKLNQPVIKRQIL